jgi:phosphohistidine phosphatase
VTLWLLRHGQAEAHAASDAQRELTDFGRQEVLQSAAHLAGQPLAAISRRPSWCVSNWASSGRSLLRPG